MKNVRERLGGNKSLKINPIPVKLHEMVLKGVNRMHWSRDINEYTLNQNQSLNEWKQYPDLDNFRVYFENQWLSGKFSNWMLFCRPAGFASTNNPCEAGLNSQIKSQYSSFERKSITGCFNLMSTILKDISKSQRFDFRVFLCPNSAKSREILKQAREYDPKLFHFTDNENCYFKFDQLNQTYKYFISLTSMFCSCSWYLDHKEPREH